MVQVRATRVRPQQNPGDSAKTLPGRALPGTQVSWAANLPPQISLSPLVGTRPAHQRSLPQAGELVFKAASALPLPAGTVLTIGSVTAVPGLLVTRDTALPEVTSSESPFHWQLPLTSRWRTATVSIARPRPQPQTLLSPEAPTQRVSEACSPPPWGLCTQTLWAARKARFTRG